MNYSVFRFTLNMHSHRSQASVATFKGDTAVRLLINLTDGGNPYVIADGCTAAISGTKADGKKLFNRCVILNNATVQYDFTEQTTSWAGVVNCDLIIYGADGNEITAPKFIIVVEEREVDIVDITSEDERTVLGSIFATEESRVLAEIAREEAETARSNSEKERAEAERLRSEAEQSRVSVETSRSEAETSRVAAETSRSEAEIARASAETARNDAEVIRNATFQELTTAIRGEVEDVEETLIKINEGGIEA